MWDTELTCSPCEITCSLFESRVPGVRNGPRLVSSSFASVNDVLLVWAFSAELVN